MAAGDLPLELRVPRHLVLVRSQEVTYREMPAFMVAAGLADVEVLRSRALGRPGEEVVVGRLGRRHEQVAELLKKAAVGLAWLHRLDRELEVDDRLGGKPRDGRGADVLEADRDRPERLADATELLPCLGGPAGVVLDDADGGVEALVERRVAPQPGWTR